MKKRLCSALQCSAPGSPNLALQGSLLCALLVSCYYVWVIFPFSMDVCTDSAYYGLCLLCVLLMRPMKAAVVQHTEAEVGWSKCSDNKNFLESRAEASRLGENKPQENSCAGPSASRFGVMSLCSAASCRRSLCWHWKVGEEQGNCQFLCSQSSMPACSKISINRSPSCWANCHFSVVPPQAHSISLFFSFYFF